MSIGMFVTAANHPQIKGIKLWALGYAFQALGWTLLGLRGEIPDFVSIIFANALIISSIALFHFALTSFRGEKSYRSFFAAVLTIFTAAFLYFTYVRPSFEIRSIITAGVGSSITFFCGYLLLSSSKRKPTLSERVMAILFFTFSLSGLLRISSFAFYYGGQRPEMFAPGALHNVVFGLLFISVLGLSLSFSLMINDRFMDEIMRLATLDSLTGTYNRAAMEKLINKEIDRARRYKLPMSFLLLDLDHFKFVNDTYGHQAGDLALKEVVKAITTELREHDILGRFGGEEFTALLPETDFASAGIVAERIRKTVEATLIVEGQKSFSMTTSIGLATLNPVKDDFHELFRRADLGLYKAKQTGRNQVVAVKDQNRSETYLDEMEMNLFKSNPSIDIPVKVKH